MREISDASLRDQLDSFLALRDRNPSITLSAWLAGKDYGPEDALAFRILLDERASVAFRNFRAALLNERRVG